MNLLPTLGYGAAIISSGIPDVVFKAKKRKEVFRAQKRGETYTARYRNFPS